MKRLGAKSKGISFGSPVAKERPETARLESILNGFPSRNGEAKVFSFKPESEGAGASPATADTAVNQELQTHATERTEWVYSDLIRELYEWFHRFNAEFFDGQLPPAVISIERANRRNMGTYQPGRDALALRYHINVNSVYVSQSRVERLDTLAHEMVHEWEEVVLGDRGGGRYHKIAFRKKAAQIGIPTDKRGVSLGRPNEGRFALLLASHGIPLDEPLPHALAVPGRRAAMPASRSRLTPWTCGCTRVWASWGTNVTATCSGCDRRFERA